MDLKYFIGKIIISKISNIGYIMSIKWIHKEITKRYPINKNEIFIVNETNNIYLTKNNNTIDIYYNIQNSTPYNIKLIGIKYKLDYYNQNIINNEESKNIPIKCLNISPKQYNFKKELNDNKSLLIFEKIKENINIQNINNFNLDRVCSSNLNIKLTFNFEYLEDKNIEKELDIKYSEITISKEFYELNKPK